MTRKLPRIDLGSGDQYPNRLRVFTIKYPSEDIFKSDYLKDVCHCSGMETKALITQVLMPRIRQLEEEVAVLRRHTWPYVQASKEAHQLDDMEAKRDFFKNLDDETVKELLRLKAKLSSNPGLQGREFDVITSLRNNFC
jgi:hypothetical protein